LCTSRTIIFPAHDRAVVTLATALLLAVVDAVGWQVGVCFLLTAAGGAFSR